MSKTYDVAVVGATGAVGEVMLEILAERNFPVGTVYALASERSAGKRVKFGNKSLVVEDLATFDFSKVQIGCFHRVDRSLKSMRRLPHRKVV